MWLWVAKFDHRKVRILVWSNPCSSWHPPPTLIFAANVAAVTSASQSIVATQASVWTARVPRITWTKWWMTGKIRKPHQVWMVKKKKVSLVFSCRLCLKKTTRSVNLSLPVAIFRHKALKGLYQRTGTPVAGMGTQAIATFLDDWPMELGYICTQYPIFVQTQMLFRAFLEIL